MVAVIGRARLFMVWIQPGMYDPHTVTRALLIFATWRERARALRRVVQFVII